MKCTKRPQKISSKGSSSLKQQVTGRRMDRRNVRCTKCNWMAELQPKGLLRSATPLKLSDSSSTNKILLPNSTTKFLSSKCSMNRKMYSRSTINCTVLHGLSPKEISWASEWMFRKARLRSTSESRRQIMSTLQSKALWEEKSTSEVISSKKLAKTNQKWPTFLAWTSKEAFPRWSKTNCRPIKVKSQAESNQPWKRQDYDWKTKYLNLPS